ncbi:MAG: D-Ala-D-Ala carboxypeptidase family metallohydrolase [Myxococcota bacterium]
MPQTRKNEQRPWWTRRSFFTAAVAFALVPGVLTHQAWRVPYTAQEVGGPGIHAGALEALNRLRALSHTRWTVVSGFRDRAHNAAVGGAKHSKHVKGTAFDVVVTRDERPAFYSAAKEAGFIAFGWGNRTVHIDTGPRRWWTYDDAGRHLSGRAKHAHLHKSPPEFQRDFRLSQR